MNPNGGDPSTAVHDELSLVRGGPFYRLQRSVGLIHPDRWNLARRIAVLLVIGLLPVIVITAISNPSGLRSLLTDYRVYSRMLLAIPALSLWRTPDGNALPNRIATYPRGGLAGFR